MKIIEARKVEVTIERPDGTIETAIHPKVDYFDVKIEDTLCRRICATIAKAEGRE